MLAQSRAMTRAAVFVRDQANTIVRLHLSDSPQVRESGERWLLEVVGPDCATFLDVGGNKGVWTELLLATGGLPKQGLIFEPSTSALAILRAKFRGAPSVTIIPKAVAEEEGRVTFYEEPNAGGTSSLVAGYSKPTARPRTVDVTTLDATLTGSPLSGIDILKIDVEGMDLRVLRGAACLLKARRVGLVQFEYNQMWLGSYSTLREAVDRLESCGMTVYLLNGRGLWEPNVRRYGEHLGLSNYLAVSPAWRDRLLPYVRGPI